MSPHHESAAAEVEGFRGWSEKVTALADAAAGLQDAADTWYDGLHHFSGPDSHPAHGQQYADAVLARNAAAWDHLLVVLEHVPAMLPRVHAAAHADEYLAGPLSTDLRQLPGLDEGVDRIVRLREEWLQVLALIDAAHPGSSEPWALQADALRNEEAWRHTATLARQTAALARAADHLSHRISTTSQAANPRHDAALARSPAPRSARQPTTPAARPPQQHPVNRRTR